MGYRSLREKLYGKKHAMLLLTLFFLLSMGLPRVVCADVKIQDLSSLFDEFLIGMQVDTFVRGDSNPAYGSKAAMWGDDDNVYGEILAQINFTAKKNIGWADLEAKFSPVFLETIGEDIYWIYNDEDDVDLDQGYVKLGNMFQRSLDLTVGCQDIQIEKQFIIGNGSFQDAAAWLLFNDPFPFAVRLDGTYGNLKGTAFWAKSQDYWQSWSNRDNVDVVGINLHYDIDENAYVYGGYYRKLDDSGEDLSEAYFPTFGETYNTEHQTDNFDIGFDFTCGDFNVEGEFNYQIGDVEPYGLDELDREDSFAWFISPKYTFPVTHAPYIKLHYIYFSGDDDPNDDEVGEYDPMFWGFPGWARWCIGEIVGEVGLPNTNRETFIFELGFWPTEALHIYTMYYKNRLVEEYFPTDYQRTVVGELSDDDWSDDVDLFVEWSASDNLWIHWGTGFSIPGDAAEEVYGDDNTAFFTQLWFHYYF